MKANGILDVFVALLQNRETIHEQLPCVLYIWTCLKFFVIVDDVEDARERGPGSTAEACSTRGLFALCLKELNEPIPDVRKSNIYFHSIK
jgi:hypothetical protein